MRRGWKRVAEYGDNRAFTLDEVSTSIVSALEKDGRDELSGKFMEGLRDLCREHEASLFKDQMGPQLEGLRDVAGPGMGRMVLEHAIQLSENGESGLVIAEMAVTNALIDRAARGARQVEEHYCRESGQTRARDVRSRIEDAIGNSSAGLNALAQRMLNKSSGPAASLVRQRGLDDGVRL
jgi:hypothetical protein